VILRSRTRDIGIFDEIFVGDAPYAPPPAVADVLSRIPGLRVLDLGGNIGLFGVYVFDRFPKASVLSLEPDPSNAAVLRRCVEINALAERWRVLEVAAAPRSGKMSFASGLFHDSHLVDTGDGAIAVETRDVFELARGFHFLKMDIQGGEWPILLDERLPFFGATALVLEWHERGSPSEPRATAIDVLSRAGFAVAADPPSPHPRGIIWAWRR
jgi:FkbM family methyltransferase